MNVHRNKTRLSFDRPWLVCSFELSPSVEFQYNKQDFFYVLVVSKNSTDPKARSYSLKSKARDNLLRLLAEANESDAGGGFPKVAILAMVAVVFIIAVLLVRQFWATRVARLRNV